MHNKYDSTNSLQDIATFYVAKKKLQVADNFFKLQLQHTSIMTDSTTPTSNKGKTINAGILGGGQLGRMLLQEAANYPVITHVLENDDSCPAAHLCHHFTKGDLLNFDDVYYFGKGLDVLTIEIESVNVEALEKLAAEGVKVFPSPKAIKTIKNKILQKQFYKDQQISSPDFVLTNNKKELNNLQSFLPAVHKLAEGGYDGRGVQVIKTSAEIDKGFDGPAVLEKMVSIKEEIAVMVAMNEKGETAVYPAVEMIFDPHLNALDYQLSPANISANLVKECENLALQVVKKLNSPGIFAVELFIDDDAKVWVNETAPRVHNSGHHTIEANYSSQFNMLWRLMLGYPLGNTQSILPSALVNILGAAGHNGEAVYEGLQKVLAMENTFVHLYGKKQTKPGRKMGHVTIVSADKNALVAQALSIKNTLQVISQ